MLILSYMKVKRQPPQKVVSMRATDEMRMLMEALAVRLTEKRQERTTLTDVMEEALRLLAKREGVRK